MPRGKPNSLPFLGRKSALCFPSFNPLRVPDQELFPLSVWERAR
jgi:hypothetical protein